MFLYFFAANKKKKMNYRKISLAALFLLTSQQVIFAQVTKTDSAKTKDEKVIEGVQLRGNTNKKSESAILVEQKKPSSKSKVWEQKKFLEKEFRM